MGALVKGKVRTKRGAVAQRTAAKGAVVTVAAVCAALLAAAAPAGAGTQATGTRPATTSGTWGKAEPVPGLAALNTGGSARIVVLSCASPGNCGALGTYTDRSFNQHAFVASEKNGTWARATQIAGVTALDMADGGFPALSCRSPGNCTAGGVDTDTSGNQQAFVASEKNGTWGTAAQIPGLAALGPAGNVLQALSCGSPGNCSAGGEYTDASGRRQAFVASEKNGTWERAQQVGGTAVSNNGSASTGAVSCTSPRYCIAGGVSTAYAGGAFVVAERNGTWGRAEAVSGITALSTGGGITALSCASVGNCSAGGVMAGNGSGDLGDFVPFLVTETNGTWGAAQKIQDAAIYLGDVSTIASVSCAWAGHCAAGGRYMDGRECCDQTFVVTQTHGTWGTAGEVPGIGAPSNQDAAVTSVSCVPSGGCAAGGYWQDPSFRYHAIVTSEQNGTWGRARDVPGTDGLSTSSAQVFSVSCAAAGSCAEGGSYTDGSGHQQAFVTH
jgi:hypothetical protein